MSTIVSPASSNIWNQPGSPRKGGILLKQLPSDGPLSPTKPTVQLPPAADHDGAAPAAPSSVDADRSSPPLASPVPAAPQVKIVDHAAPTRQGGRPTTKAPRPASIKFAPLPAPRQQRSLSTGRNVKLAATLNPGGERTEELQTRGGSNDDGSAAGAAGSPLGRRRSSDDSGLLDGVGLGDDNDDGGLRDDGGSDDDDDEGRRKRLSSSMLGSSWTKGTMKLFGVKSGSSSSKKLDRTSSIESTNSAVSGHTSDLSAKFSSLTRTLSPSVSRSSNNSDSADRQARLLASLSPEGARDSPSGHRRGPSGGALDVPLSSSLSASPSRSLVGARMLNGRAYGVRGGVEAIKKAEEDALRGPEFSEWGSAGSMGSNSAPGADDDDGSGVSWARKRREAREKAAAERAAAEAASAAAGDGDPSLLLSPQSDTAASLTSVSSSSPVTPRSPSAALDGGEPASADSVALSETDLDSEMERQLQHAAERKQRALSHDVQAFTVPGHPHAHPNAASATRTPDGDGAKTPTPGRSAASSHATVNAISIGGGGAGAHGRGVVVDSDEEDDLDLSDSDSDNDDEPRDDDDDEDGSSDEDDDDKAAMEEARKTALCAGVEVVSRHKSIPS